MRILRRSTDSLIEDPVREEIFSVERLEQYASYLASVLKVSSGPGYGTSLLPDLKRNGKELVNAYLALAEVIRKKQNISPAAEWFVDNFFIVEEQLNGIKRDLPANYYRELSKLSEGELRGYPRIYALALAFIAHTDSRLDVETLRRFILAFQKTSPLNIGEVWALPITLRISLIQHLKPLALLIVSARKKRSDADALADKLLDIASGTEPEKLISMLSKNLGPTQGFDRSFIVQLIQRLRDQDPEVWPVLEWLEKQLRILGTDMQQVIQFEHHRQAAAQTTVGNIISSLRMLSDLDWRDFFESVSVVDPLLALDPAGAYLKMDFATRDLYRHSVERIARGAKKKSTTETDVVKKALSLATVARTNQSENHRHAHIGFYLYGGGLQEFEELFSYVPPLKVRILRLTRRFSTLFYLGGVGLLTALSLSTVAIYGNWWFCLFAVVPASEFALSIFNFYVTTFIKPKALPKMDFEKGIPEDAKTIVVIPTLFSSENVVLGLLAHLEVQYYGNQDEQIFFALLGDFTDASSAETPRDRAILECATKGIEELNLRHGSASHKPFRLFHRLRLWNPSEDRFMGWERKRGKLLEFNRLIRGAKDTSFLPLEGDLHSLLKIKYVITLDSDTELPRGAARRLIGTISHPLNQPEINQENGRVTRGYGILQPRISVSLTSASASRFARIFSGNTGLDPYTTAVSDVYQDLFAEGSFTGKGLYVVDAFESALKDRVPENSVLSHDLFEGSFARSALVTDIELFDDYPSDYESFSKRAHRWTRGDWQLFPWLFRRVRNAQGVLVKNDLSLISRWKIFDNLRRSLVAPATLLCLIFAWTTSSHPWGWTLALSVFLAFPVYLPLLILDMRGFFADIGLKIEQVILLIAFLPVQSWMQIDAVIRTLYRKTVSGKNLLEWVSFAQTETEVREKFSDRNFIDQGLLQTMVIIALVILFQPHAIFCALPFLILWVGAPFFKMLLRRKPRALQKPLGKNEIKTYRHYARLTWHFFEKFVREEDNYLAPDNFQEDPVPIVAHRTSPTNMGLQLLATISAYDFGYIGLNEFVERLEKTFTTLCKLQRMEGHFFNWYDTLTLDPLSPRYISTVDSGNLAGHLLTLKQACLEIGQKPAGIRVIRQGLADTLFFVLQKTLMLDGLALQSHGASRVQFQSSIEEILNLARSEPFPHLQKKLVEADGILKTLEIENGAKSFSQIRIWMDAGLHQIAEYMRDASGSEDAKLSSRLKSLALQSEKFVLAMNFRFLFDETRKIFAIGYNVSDGKMDNSFYDLLASESRLASFVAIAKGDVSQEHWFRLGRSLTSVLGGRALIAWTATMFEYLMPTLIMRSYRKTLLDQTYISVVKKQIDYGKQHRIPWGISESGYNARDLNLNYQYGPFGIPGLGLKRGLSDDLVISPYSTMLAAAVDPWAALENLRHLDRNGMLSLYGFFESADYTVGRVPDQKKFVIIKSFMAHHQGMSLVALNNLLHANIMQKRFHAEPIVQATELLLQERIPYRVEITRPRAEEVHSEHAIHFLQNLKPRVYTDLNPFIPRIQLLSNGTYTVMVSSSGGGYSTCGPLSISRWREDGTRDSWGQFFYIRDRESGVFWSPTYQPVLIKPDDYEVSFAEDRAEFWLKYQSIQAHTEIIVSPEDNVELRRISLTNLSDLDRELDITSYLETTFSKAQDDAAHPAFSNLFVQTEFAEGECALLATRRRRSESEKQIWGFHVCVTEGEALGAVQYETDRARFLGRGRTVASPQALTELGSLSNSVGSVLDPLFSLRSSVRIPAGASVRICFATGVAETREQALRLADKYHDTHIFSREADIAWTQSQVQLRHLNIRPEKADAFQRLAGRVIYSDPSLRSRAHVLALNTKTQSGLWAYGISGDVPIILMRITHEKDVAMVRELLHAHEYLRLKGLKIDLVILNERPPSYMQSLQDELQRLIRVTGSQALLDKPGGIFIRRTDLMPEADVTLFKFVARVILSAAKGDLDEQLERRPIKVDLPAVLANKKAKQARAAFLIGDRKLEFFNGLGGFDAETGNYIIVLKEDQNTPAPWINVIANSQDFGFQISESGSGYTWSANSRENRLTSWSNDAVSDPPSEAFYIRDEESGEIWSPTPLPIRESESYVVTHGQGFSKFEHISHEIAQELKLFVDSRDGVKISRLRLQNLSDETRQISVTNYVEWVLGFQRGVTAPSVITEWEEESGTLFARNPYNNEFAGRVAFLATSENERTFTCNRKEFLGRNGRLDNPAALKRTHLSGSFGAGLDPCGALQVKLSLEPGEEREILFVLGQAETKAEARRISLEYRKIPAAKKALQDVQSEWKKISGAIEIKTPDRAMDLLVNHWLIYQTLSCRLWARSAFYQSGGAFGFRDQLQDVMALAYSKPALAKEQILRAARRQFSEGDVQHWWHPPTGRGVRTRFSDDLLWLPFVVSFYVKITGDRSLLQEEISFIEGPLLESGVDDSYTQPAISHESASLFEHCARALDRSLKVGSHGLPLMGSGDWNDGMSRVGHLGLGESVWVAWFLYASLEQFLPFCDSPESSARQKAYAAHLVQLKRAVESEAWDGAWYRRAYFDDGTSLGSAAHDECQIDSIAQTWAVLSGAGDAARARVAMSAVDERLVQEKEGLIKLFTPPFDKGKSDPGYIKGYVPGVRENGGQYTHAAIWVVMAHAASGNSERATELYSLLNPIHHASNPADMARYKVEPYVMAADIYGLQPHVGRGGWTWYTGSASWMYRAALESILGFELHGKILRIRPAIPKAWPGFTMIYRTEKSEYRISVLNVSPSQLAKQPGIELDGVKQASNEIALVEDGRVHEIRVQL